MTKLDKILTAIARNQIAAFKRLVTADIVDTVDEDGYSLLACVVLDEDADAEMARHLIDLGAAINHVDAPDEKWTALALALRDGRVEIAKMLLEAGAKAIAKDSSGNTPLHYAMHCLSYDHIPREPILDMIAALLARGADPTLKNRDGDSPYARAKRGKLPKVVAMFQQAIGHDAAQPAVKKKSTAKPRSKGKAAAKRRAKATVKPAKKKAK